MKMIAIIAATGLALSSPASAEQAKAPPATIADASWLAGRWVGEGLGGKVEEVWSPAVGGQMVGHFQLVKDGKPVFYEILLLDATPDGLRMRVKHFNADFTAWEDKAQWVTFASDGVAPGVIRFKGLTLENRGDRVTMKLKMRGKGGEVREEAFEFRRAPL